MIVTIDGPAGAGKSTVAKTLAGRLGFEFLDTGAMYRTIALKLLREGGLEHLFDLEHWIHEIEIRFEPGRAWLCGEEVTGEIRTPEVTRLVSPVAENALVRQKLVAIQKAYGVGRSLVTEGRDQGTAVFPDSPCKFFLVADVLERARRRKAELEKTGVAVHLEELAAQIAERDRRDANREIGPMIAAPDAIHVDSTGLTIPEVVDHLHAHVEKRKSALHSEISKNSSK